MGKKVGKLIKAARTDADMTQEQLARRISGLSANDISLAERGEKDLTQVQLKKIAAITGVTQASLINAAKGENKSSKKTTTTKKTTTAKTPANANSTMKVTATERKLTLPLPDHISHLKKLLLLLLKSVHYYTKTLPVLHLYEAYKIPVESLMQSQIPPPGTGRIKPTRHRLHLPVESHFHLPQNRLLIN